MLKKAIPLFLLSALVLGGCTANKEVPNKNETPMEDVQDRERNWTPNVNENQKGGTNLDGIDENRDVNGNGTINGNNDNGVINDGTNTVPNETIIEEDVDVNTNRMNR